MNFKKIEKLVAAAPPHDVGNGYTVSTFLPLEISLDRMSPFYLVDYNAKLTLSPTNEKRGVDTHPHRGLEFITMIFEGKVVHKDSLGNTVALNSGDILWLTAGSGILHNLVHEEDFSKKGGDFQMATIWINLPKEYKMTPPKYQVVTKKGTPTVQLEQAMGRVEVIAGEYKNKKGNITTFSPIEMYNVFLEKGGKATFSFPENYNTGLLILEGTVQINEEETAIESNFVIFENKGKEILLEAKENLTLLLLSGEPLNDPVVAHGPFIMNSQAEIIKAYDDYNEGSFGEITD